MQIKKATFFKKTKMVLSESIYRLNSLRFPPNNIGKMTHNDFTNTVLEKGESEDESYKNVSIGRPGKTMDYYFISIDSTYYDTG